MPIKYCLSEPAPDQCVLYFNTSIAVMVNSINAAKLLAFIFIFFAIRSPPLLTIGDAVASFLERPDETTRGLGTVSKKDFSRFVYFGEPWLKLRKPYKPRRRRWVAAVGGGRVVSAALL